MANSVSIIIALMIQMMTNIINDRKMVHNELALRDTCDSEYDFVIVGAGSAGSVVANRLSADGRFKVLLLEAGGPETLTSDTTALNGKLTGTELDWNYTTVPQQYSSHAYVNSITDIPRGKVLGGTSVINSMQYSRGVPRDYDNWAQKHGAEGWSWTDVRKYFLKSEEQTDPDFKLDTDHHSTKGELTISSCKDPPFVQKLFIDAAVSNGYKHIDLNAEETGIGVMQLSVRNGARCSTARAFLEPARNRNNLHILAHSLATKINFDDKNRAIGVTFETKNGTKISVKARKEVIVSAGAINSPQLLMLSGIGPKSHLEQLKIKVIADLPVGDHLQDHPYISDALIFTTNGLPKSSDDDQLSLENMMSFYVNGTGPLSNYSETCLRASTKYAEMNDGKWPDIMLYAFGGSLASYDGKSAQKNGGMKASVWEHVFMNYTKEQTMHISMILARPKSEGTVRLKTINPKDAPLIDPRYLSDESDIKKLVEGMKLGYKIILSEPFKRFNTKPLITLYPDCEHLYRKPQIPESQIPNDEFLACVVQQLTIAGLHLGGSCRMGRDTDSKSVVNPQLKVRKVSNLRVIDASIAPELVAGHFNAVAIMIGERGADLVLADYK